MSQTADQDSGRMDGQLTIQDDFPAVDYETWKAVAERDLRGAPFEKKLITHTYEGIDLMPVYTGADWSSAGDPSGLPGMGVHTRGSDPLGASVCGWDICQEHADPDIQLTHEMIMEDLERGVTALLLRFDAAIRDGMDVSTPGAEMLCGQDGLMVYTLDDLDALLKDVHLNMVGLHLEAGMSAPVIAAQIAALLKRREIDATKVRGALNMDPLAVLARRGELPCEMEEALRRMVDLAAWTNKNLPRFRAIRVGTGPYHHAGSTAAQDLGYSMATALVYLRAMLDAGIPMSDACKQLQFNYNLGTNFFLATAKLRAARTLWSKVIQQCGGTEDDANMVIHARGSKRVITQRDPWVNMLRGTVCTFAAAIGGAQIITCEPFDKALGLPNEFSRRIARNTQIILAEESHLGRVVDPAGGAWMVEKLTDQLCEKAWAVLQSVESDGGMAHALKTGKIAEQIDSAFKSRLKNIAVRKDAVTGVSEFPNLNEKAVEKREPDYAALKQTAASRLAERSGLDESSPVLAAIHDATLLQDQPGDITQAIYEAVEQGASVGLVCSESFRDGRPLYTSAIAPHPYAEPFEELRDASDVFLATTGHRPRVLLVTLGSVAEHTARATYARNFFEAGGFETVATQPITGDASEMANAATSQRSEIEGEANIPCSIVCICSTDTHYEAAAGEVAAALKSAGCRTVILAGFPGDKKDTYTQAGIDQFIFMKCDVLGTLRELLRDEGVLIEGVLNEGVLNAEGVMAS